MTQPIGYILTQDLPPIPIKRYFTIGEVSDLCSIRSYVLRYWEQEFPQLSPMKRRGNRRYYQHHEVLLVRTIRELLYEQGYTIQGARQQIEQKATVITDSFDLLEDNSNEILSNSPNDLTTDELAQIHEPLGNHDPKRTAIKHDLDSIVQELHLIRNILDLS